MVDVNTTEARSFEHNVRAFEVEHRGIDLIPEPQRWASARAVGAMWAGSSFNVEYFIYGTLLMAFGFSFTQAVVITVIGNLSFLLLGVASLQGPSTGTTTFTIGRAAFGSRGARGVAFLNWITMLGFETEGLILVVGALITLSRLSGVGVGTNLKVAFIVVAVTLQAVVPYFGHATMMKVLRSLIAPFALVYLALMWFALNYAHASFSAPAPVTWPLVTAGIAFTIALSGLGWTECGNDYSRYVRADTPPRSIVGWIFLGTALPQAVLMILGAAIFTVASSAVQVARWNSANPFDALAHLSVLPSWFTALFLVVAVIQLFAINSLDLYSSGVSLQAVGLPLRRYQAVLVDSVLAGALTAWAEFQGTFSLFMKEFVGVIIVWITPWFTVFIIDWLLRGRRYDAAELQRTDRSGLYFAGSFGVNLNAVVAFALGMVASIIGFSKAPPPVNFPFHWMTPLSNHFGASCAGPLSGGACPSGWYGGADFSLLTGSVVAAVVYLGLEAVTGTVRAQRLHQR